jgi:hypothetical protein
MQAVIMASSITTLPLPERMNTINAWSPVKKNYAFLR